MFLGPPRSVYQQAVFDCQEEMVKYRKCIAAPKRSYPLPLTQTTLNTLWTKKIEKKKDPVCMLLFLHESWNYNSEKKLWWGVIIHSDFKGQTAPTQQKTARRLQSSAYLACEDKRWYPRSKWNTEIWFWCLECSMSCLSLLALQKYCAYEERLGTKL